VKTKIGTLPNGYRRLYAGEKLRWDDQFQGGDGTWSKTVGEGFAVRPSDENRYCRLESSPTSQDIPTTIEEVVW